VVTEWVPHERRWLTPLQAAGFESLGAGEGYVTPDAYERIKRTSQQHGQ